MPIAFYAVHLYQNSLFTPHYSSTLDRNALARSNDDCICGPSAEPLPRAATGAASALTLRTSPEMHWENGLAISGRFLNARMTGVYRVGFELTRQIEKNADAIAEIFGAPPRILAPRNAPEGVLKTNLAVERGRFLTGPLWEQLELPVMARGSLLLSFCNLSPILSRESVTMIHDAQAFSTPASYSLAFRTFYRVVQPVIGRRAHAILTVSAFSQDQIVQYGIAAKDRVHVIHNGCDHGAHRAADPAALHRFGLEAGRYVLALASDQPHKNIAVLLKAFADPRLAGYKLVLFGSDGAETVQRIGEPIPSGAVFTDRIPADALAGLMTHALCLAMPSTTEGFGLPPLEAMHMGCPAIVAPCGALPEICGDAALYAAPHAPEQWVAAIRQLAEDAGFLEALRARGHARAKAFSWDKAGDTLIETLRALKEQL